MPEESFLHYQLRAPTSGYTFRCIPNGPSYRYYPAVKCVFPEWAAPGYSVIDEYRHGSIMQGGLVLGQHSVAHSALSGNVVFELPALPLQGAGEVIRLSSSLTYGRTAMYGKWSSSGVLKNDGKVVTPYNGTFTSSIVGNFALQAFEYSLPYVHPVGWTEGEVGHKYSGLSLKAKSVSYSLSVRNWQARQGSSGAWTTAAGYRQEWDVSVTLDSSGFHGRARTTLNENVVALRGALVWSTAAALYDDWDFAESKIAKVTSSAVGASMLPIIAFDVIVQGARLWASKDFYAEDRAQVHNDALDSYRSLHSNNIENAVQFQQIRKLLPLDTARLVPHLKAELMPVRRGLLMAKIVSGLYLWWRYVIKTTYKDLKELIEAIPTLYPKENTIDMRAKIDVEKDYEFPNSSWVAETIRASPYNLQLLPLRVGLHPGLAQAWDLIPFSFVVDWFFSISNNLNAIDWFFYKSFMNLRYRICSRKTKVLIDASEFGGAGEVKISFYVRAISLAWPGFSDSVPAPRWVPTKNWAPAAAALAIANWKLKRG